MRWFSHIAVFSIEVEEIESATCYKDTITLVLENGQTKTLKYDNLLAQESDWYRLKMAILSPSH